MFYRDWRFLVLFLYIYLIAVYRDDLSPLWIAITVILGLGMFGIQLTIGDPVLQLAVVCGHLLLLVVGYAKARWPA